jgi:hypothetical protein
MRTSSEGRPRVQSAAIACAIVLAGAVACGAKAASLTCGEGTHVSGTMCVAGEGDATDARADGEAKEGKESGTVDAKARTGGRDAAPDGRARDTGSTQDGATSDAGDGEASVPVSCGDLNACVPTGSTGGPIDWGMFDSCQGLDYDQLPAAYGDQSAWLTVRILNGCNSAGSFLVLDSQPTAIFDLEVYEVPDPVPSTPPSSCPTLIGSGVATTPDCCGGPTATVSVPNTGEVYIHVVAQPGATCSTGAQWELGVGAI